MLQKMLQEAGKDLRSYFEVRVVVVTVTATILLSCGFSVLEDSASVRRKPEAITAFTLNGDDENHSEISREVSPEEKKLEEVEEGACPWSFTDEEMKLFARLVHSEAQGEPYKGKVGVAASVLNRLESDRYPDDLSEVVFQIDSGYYQYSPVLDGSIWEEPGESAYQAVEDAVNGWDPTGHATGFYNPRKTNNLWVRQQPVTQVIGEHVFFQ